MKAFLQEVPWGPALGWAAGAAIVGVLLYDSSYTIEETERGLSYTFGSLDPQGPAEVLRPGLHWKLPFAQTVRLMPVDIQSLVMGQVRTYTRDNQEMTATLVVNYRLPGEQLVRIAQRNPDFIQKLDAMTQDRFKKVLGVKESADISQQRREIVAEVTEDVARSALELYGIEVLEVQMPRFNFKAQFENAVELAAIEKTKVKAQEQIRAQEAIKAETAKIKAAGQADAAIEAARGKRDSIKLEADAVAYKIEREGAAKAAASEQLAAALAQNPWLVQYKLAEQWDGRYPAFVGGPNAMPLLQMDLGAAAGAGAAGSRKAAAEAPR